MSTRSTDTFPHGITVHRDSLCKQWQVRLQDHPAATYRTDNRDDALATAEEWSGKRGREQAVKTSKMRSALTTIINEFPDANLQLVAVGLGAATAITQGEFLTVMWSDGSKLTIDTQRR